MDHIIDDSDRLKPCPFCGAEAEIITLQGETDDPSIGAQCVQCTSSACGAASGLIYPLMDDVTHLLIERWNKRHNTGGKPPSRAVPAGWKQLLDRVVPRLDAGGPNPINEVEHCCEWTLYRERERIHNEFADIAAQQQGGGEDE